MRLARVEVHREERAWAGAALLPGDRRTTWILRLTTDTGRVASGEVAWLPRAGPEPDIVRTLTAWAWGWLGRPPPPATQDPGLPPPLAWAVTTALAELHDGPASNGAIPENGLLASTGDDPTRVARDWSETMAAHPEIRVWKIKVGRTSLDQDLARLRALDLPEGVRLRLDPNRGWGDHDPHAVAQALEGLPLDYLEEPAPWPTLASWARAGLPCAADESVLDVDLDALARAGIRAVVLKPSMMGGLGRVQELVRAAESHGMAVVVSSALEGPVGRSALETLVASLEHPHPAGLARDVLEEPPRRVGEPSFLSADVDPLRRAADLFPHAVALEDGVDTLTFAAWHQQADALARTLGDRRGERMVVTIEGLEGAVRLLAILRAGAIACLVPPGAPGQAAIAQVQAQPWSPGSGIPPGIDLGRPATLIWSSGSQGTPRAIAHSLGQHLSSAAASDLHTPFREGDRWLASLRMHHVGGLALLFRALYAGGTVVFPGERPLDALHPTHISWVPTQLMRASKTPPPGLKALLLGGAAAPPELVRSRRALGWPVKTTYGSTEVASQACTSTVHADPAESGAVLVGRVVRADPIVQIAGTTVCLGVWSNGQIQPLTTDDGWLVTGDVGEITAHHTLRVRGRADTMFISGGENVFPESIERVLGAHPNVRAVVVVAVPDPVWGARPWAFVDGELDLEQARAYSEGRLPRYAWVDRVLPWSDEGVGATGKPRRAWFGERALTILKGPA